MERRLIFTALHEAFITYLKVAFFCSFSLLVLFLTKFGNLAPGLYKNEKGIISLI